MSRAFVRELDTELPEDVPERPLSPHPNRVTPQGLAQLQQRLQAVERQLARLGDEEVGQLLERAELGREQRWLQARIAGAIVVAAPRDPERVEFGASVELLDEQERRYCYRIVGEDEAEPERGRVSWISPLARALMGARIGDEVVWPRPAGDRRVEVLSIRYEQGPPAQA